ncbi:adenomatosis polyposis coli down-regulated 1, partial [Elysia marginata]
VAILSIFFSQIDRSSEGRSRGSREAGSRARLIEFVTRSLLSLYWYIVYCVLARPFLASLVRCPAATATQQGSMPHFVYQEDWSEKTCGQVLDKVRHSQLDIPMPPDITGEWVSHRCEIRSGPEYVIRHLKVSQDQKFESIVYLYSDPDCHHPMYAVHTLGSHVLKQASWTVRGGTEAKYEIYSSYLIPYTHNATASVSHRLAGTGCYGLLTSRQMVPYRKYLIYSIDPEKPELVNKKNKVQNNQIKDNGYLCFQALNFTLNELLLVMLEVKHRRQHRHHHRQPHHYNKHHHISHIPGSRRGQNYNQHHRLHQRNHRDHLMQTEVTRDKEHLLNGQTEDVMESSPKETLQLKENQNSTKSNVAFVRDEDNVGANDGKSSWPWPELVSRELLLGAVHSRPQEKLSHTPSSFQAALKDARTPGCGVCSRIASSSLQYPPRLSIRAGTLLSLEGEWVSTRCESRQYGMFLTRRLHFLSDGSSWQGQYDYYHDALCKHPSFSLNAKGSYSGGSDSKLIPRAKDYSFRVTRLKVTPHDERTAESMNHYSGNGCGKAHAWKAGKEQDVTWTGGCVTLGIRLPNMERDIMRMDVMHRKLLLYVGQRLVDRKPGTAYQMERPTAFQEPLVKCDQHDLDMSINTAPGGHGWAGGIALPLAAGSSMDGDGKPYFYPAAGECCRNNVSLVFASLLIWTIYFFRSEHVLLV